MQNFIKLSAAVHELSCWQTSLPYLTMVKDPNVRSWPLTQIFNVVLEVVNVQGGSK